MNIEEMTLDELFTTAERMSNRLWVLFAETNKKNEELWEAYLAAGSLYSRLGDAIQLSA